jgi:hypothetical protein
MIYFSIPKFCYSIIWPQKLGLTKANTLVKILMNKMPVYGTHLRIIHVLNNNTVENKIKKYTILLKKKIEKTNQFYLNLVTEPKI